MLSHFSHVQLCVTLWTIACQAPLSTGFSRQEYWSGLPFLSPGDLPNPGIEPGSPELQADSLPSEPPGKPKISPNYLPKNSFQINQQMGFTVTSVSMSHTINHFFPLCRLDI